MRPEAKKRYLSALRIVLALLLLPLLAGCQKDYTWKVGASAPEISLLDLQERTVKLSSLRGKVVVLRFWASGCKECVAGMPAMDDYSRRFRERGVAVVAVNMGNSREFVEAFVGNMHLGYPVLRDPELIAARKYHVSAVPTTFFIDRLGIARKVVSGEVSRELFEKEMAELI